MNSPLDKQTSPVAWRAYKGGSGMGCLVVGAPPSHFFAGRVSLGPAYTDPATGTKDAKPSASGSTAGIRVPRDSRPAPCSLHDSCPATFPSTPGKSAL